MFQIIKSATFDVWLLGLRDVRARASVNARITRMQTGHLGDVKALGDGLQEARIFYGPGYRLYFIQQGGCADCFALWWGQRESATRYREGSDAGERVEDQQ